MRILLVTLLLCNCYILSAQIETSCSQTISGEVRDQFSNELLPGAEMVLLDKDGKIIESQVVTESATFSFNVQCATEYKLEAKKQEYTTESKSFTTSDEADLELKTVVLLGTGEIDFVSDAANKKKEELKVDSTVVETPVIKEKIEETQVTEEVKVPVKEPVKESVSRNTSKIKPIYFDYESSWLNVKAKQELLTIVKMMKANSSMIIECAGHADSKGETNYNQWMSDRRAKRAIDFIVSNGIDRSRISGRGYGESQPINNCTDNTNCSDAQRAVNRRTEFVIVKR